MSSSTFQFCKLFSCFHSRLPLFSLPSLVRDCCVCAHFHNQKACGCAVAAITVNNGNCTCAFVFQRTSVGGEQQNNLIQSESRQRKTFTPSFFLLSVLSTTTKKKKKRFVFIGKRPTPLAHIESFKARR